MLVPPLTRLAPQQVAARALALVPSLTSATLRLRPACMPHASPSWHGVDSMSILLDEGGEPLHVFAKAPDPDLELFGDAKAASASAVIAGGLGIGPQVIAHDDRGLIVAEALTDGWRVATLADLALPDTSLAVLRA